MRVDSKSIFPEVRPAEWNYEKREQLLFVETSPSARIQSTLNLSPVNLVEAFTIVVFLQLVKPFDLIVLTKGNERFFVLYFCQLSLYFVFLPQCSHVCCILPALPACCEQKKSFLSLIFCPPTSLMKPKSAAIVLLQFWSSWILYDPHVSINCWWKCMTSMGGRYWTMDIGQWNLVFSE